MNIRNIALLLFIYLFTSCHNHEHDQHDEHNHTNDHGHDHSETKLYITAYSDQFEVFAEADPLVAGVTTSVLAHFTHLDSFKPLTEGIITLIVESEGERTSYTAETPSKPGIYRFSVKPPSTGVNAFRFEIEAGEGIHTIDAGSYEAFVDDHDAAHAAEDTHVEHPAIMSFTKEQSWNVNFATAPVQQNSLGAVIKSVGEVMPGRTDEITLTAQTQGIVRFVQSNLYEGARLSAGEILLNISGEGLAEGNATQRFLEAENNYTRAKADYERISELAGENIVSQRQLLEAKNEFENARATYENLSANFSEKGQVIKSPASGYITQIMVTNGQFVEPGQPIARIAQNRSLMIRTEIQQRHSQLLPNLATANIKDSRGQWSTLEELGGEILPTPRNTNDNTHLLPVHIQLTAAENWITGTLVDVYLKTAETQPYITVPNTALIEEQGNYFVLVQLNPENFEKREVKTGQTDGMETEIIHGLTENERVVSTGALLVKMAAASTAIDPHSGHVH